MMVFWRGEVDPVSTKSVGYYLFFVFIWSGLFVFVCDTVMHGYSPLCFYTHPPFFFFLVMLRSYMYNDVYFSFVSVSLLPQPLKLCTSTD